VIPIARFIIILGIVLIVIGGLLYLAGRLNLPLGRLPGDIRIGSGNATCVIALGTSILLSIVLTVLLNLIGRFFK
jgi:hypothetical protein